MVRPRFVVLTTSIIHYTLGINDGHPAMRTTLCHRYAWTGFGTRFVDDLIGDYLLEEDRRPVTCLACLALEMGVVRVWMG